MKNYLFLGLVFLCLVFGTCSKYGGTAKEGERDQLVVAVPTEPQNFVPLSASMSSDYDQPTLFHIYDTLFKKDWEDGGKVIPYLAENYEVSSDGLQIKVKIRTGVTFHDGSKLTAEDFKFTYDMAKGYTIGNVLFINYNYTEVVDELNFIIHMTHPYAPILNSLAARISPVMSKAYFEKVGGLEEYAKKPIGTGPFKFVSRTSGDSVVLERYDNYWGPKPVWKKVTIKVITDVNTQMMAVETGDVDVAIGVPIDNLVHINNPNIKWDVTGANTSSFLQFNMQDDKWVQKDLNFRKAVQAAVDRGAINEAVYNGSAMLIDIYGHPQFSGRPSEGTYETVPKNLDKAREYLQASTYKGQQFRLITLAGTVNEKISQVIQGSLQEIGINMDLFATDGATYNNTIRGTGDFEAQFCVHGSSVFDEDSYYNYFGYGRYDFKNIAMPRGKELNDLVEAGRVEADPEKRIAVYRKISNINTEDAILVFTNLDLHTILFRSGIKGIKADMAKFYRFHEWTY